jgi:hypothetical protein
MKFIILLGIFLLLSTYFIGFAKAEDVAYEFKQTSIRYGPSDLILDRDGAKVDVPNLDARFIFLEAQDKIQILNLKQHKTATIDLQRWVKDGPPTYNWMDPPTILPDVQGKRSQVCGLSAVMYKGGPDKPEAFDPAGFGISKGLGRKDVWLYSEATFCNEFELSTKMYQFLVGLFRLGQAKHLYPLGKVDYCQSGPKISLQTTAVKKIDPRQCNIAFEKGYREVSLSDVASSARKDDFALELIKGFSLGKGK